MALMKKKGKSGAAKKYVSRGQALRKLQLPLKVFRRLCILKGVYPREPANKKKASGGKKAPSAFYAENDIRYMLHEPLVDTFRQQKVYSRQLRHAIAKRDSIRVRKLANEKPALVLDHIIKERYPAFSDALSDIDDALCMIFLFANMPKVAGIDESVISNCERLAAEFQHYIVKSGSLTKAFFSVKGIYFQARIQEQDVTWLVPYKFSQTIPYDVDFRVMATFLELYQTLLEFVFYKLYTGIALSYPPKLQIFKNERELGFVAHQVTNASCSGNIKAKPKMSAKDLRKRAALLPSSYDAIAKQDQEDFARESKVSLQSSTENAVKKLDNETNAGLFSNLVFYLSRETPVYVLEFALLSHGASVSWDATVGNEFTFPIDSERITHHVIDRPSIDRYFMNRTYVQPQWIFDCINSGKLLETTDYTIGATLPPHMSPFVSKEDDVEASDIELEISDDENNYKNEVVAEMTGQDVKNSKSKKKSVKKTVDLQNEMAKAMMPKKKRQLYEKLTKEKRAKDKKIENIRRRKRELATKN